MPGILGLFNILALIYVFRSLQLAGVVWREWSDLNQEPLTPHKKHLAEQAAFFLAVPVGVLLHELGHVVAVWLFGGRVVEFGYRVFWGYVVPQGVFSASEEWFISLAGTLGNLAFGGAMWLLLRHYRASSLRYFALRAFRFQVYFALIYYPLFTLFLPIGDWRTIYDFGATPVLSGLTAVAHAGLLGLFWWGDRQGWFQMASHESASEQKTFQALAREAAANPYDEQLQFYYVDALRRGGAISKARRQLTSFLKQHPNSGPAHLQLALLQSEGKPHISRRGSRNVRKALSLGLPDPQSTSHAHRLLSQYYLDVDQVEEALSHVNQALALAAADTLHMPHTAYLYHLRSRIHRRQRQFEEAYQDVQQAIAQAEATGDEQAVAYYRNELDIVEKHAGRALNAPPGRVP